MTSTSPSLAVTAVRPVEGEPPAESAPPVQPAPRMGLDRWRAFVSRSIVPLQIDEVGGVEFHGRIAQASVDDAAFFEIAATPHIVRRTPHLIALSPGRHYKLSLQLEGTAVLEQDGRQAVITPGDLAIYDTHRPYTLRFLTANRALVAMFPPELVDLTPGEISRVTALRFPQDDGLGRVINPFFVQLGRNLDQLRDSDGSRLIRPALSLLGTLLSTELRRLDDDDASPNRALLRQVRTHVRGRLRDPTLTPASIARAHYISTRRLHALFAGEPETVAAWIRSLRLEHIRRDLGDPLHAHRSVSAIAARWGFPDAAHFSRAFKAEFGESPSVCRNRVLHEAASASRTTAV